MKTKTKFLEIGSLILTILLFSWYIGMIINPTYTQTNDISYSTGYEELNKYSVKFDPNKDYTIEYSVVMKKQRYIFPFFTRTDTIHQTDKLLVIK